MAPALASADLVNSFGLDAEFLRQLPSVRGAGADFPYRVGREFCPMVLLAAPSWRFRVAPPAQKGVFHVVAMRSGDKVRRIAARRIIAGVAGFLFRPQVATQFQAKNGAVGMIVAAVIGHRAVAWGLERALPFPTVVRPASLYVLFGSAFKRAIDGALNRLEKVATATAAIGVWIGLGHRRIMRQPLGVRNG